MAAPVWVLSVDLQTKTATFQSGMSEAAKSARSAFTEIKGGSSEMSIDVGRSMTESREGVILLGEAFGVHLPRGVSSFIASVGPLSAALEAAFPFVAIAVGAITLLELLTKMHEAGEKLTEDQVHFGIAAQTAFNQLDQKLLEAGIRADELRNDHLGALSKRLELIDRQSMDELVHSFEEVAKAADTVFGDLKSHWYTFGTGATGAKHALTEFKGEYDKLLSLGKNQEASDLLKGTRESAEHVLSMQKQAADAMAGQQGKAGTDVEDQIKYARAKQELQKAGVGYTEKEVQAQQILVDSLRSQASIEEKVAALKNLDSNNAKTATGKDLGAMAAAAAREAAEHAQKMGELSLANDREQAAVSLTTKQASIAERLASDLALADKEYQIQLQGNAQLIAALDKGGKDYQNQLKALHDKTEELTAQHANTVASLQGKASEQSYQQGLRDLEVNERAKIEATDQGTQERVAALTAALKNEDALNLENTAHYRELLNQKAQAVQAAAGNEAKQAEQAGKIAAENTLKVGQMGIAAEKEQTALRDSVRHVSEQQKLAEAIQFANEEYQVQVASMNQQIAALDKGGKDYENKLKELQDKQLQLTQQHENEITQIKDKAEMQQNQNSMAAMAKFESIFNSGLAQVIMGHKSFASMMSSIGDQVVSGVIQNALKMAETASITQLANAKIAATNVYGQVSAIPVVGPFLAPELAAAAFVGVMAFASGGIVPGVGRGDTVPAMLTPGEGVIPGGVMDQLSTMARSGNMGGNVNHHVHVRPVYHLQAMDSEGMARVLDKHSNQLQKHFENSLRKMNR